MSAPAQPEPRRRAAGFAVAVLTMLVAAVVLRAAFSAEARDDGALPLWSLALAAVWFAGGVALLRLARRPTPAPVGPPVLARRPVLASFGIGALVAAASFVGGLVLLSVPFTADWISSAVQAATSVPLWVTVLVALIAGAAEEVFFRLGLTRLFDGVWAWVIPTLAYTAVTVASGNTALAAVAPVLAVAAMAALVTTRRWWAPLVVHAVWTIGMVWLFPALTGDIVPIGG